MTAGALAEREWSEGERTPGGVRAGLSLMMFLQYAIWGAWLPILWPYLAGHRGFQPAEIGDIFAVGAVGAIVGPFLAGQLADRRFATQRYLAASHLVGAVLVWFLASIETYAGFLMFSLAYSIVYAPTLALTNSLALHHLRDRNREFGPVRLWGTIGWIAAGIAVGQWLLHMHTPGAAGGGAAGPPLDDALIAAAQAAGRADAFKLSALLGLAMAALCLALPHTPPRTESTDNAAFKALAVVRRNPLLTLFLVSIPVSCVHQFYFVHTAGFLGVYQARAEGAVAAINQVFGVGGGGLMTIGQMVEISVLMLIPLVARSLSRKSLLLIGLLAYTLRMALFTYVDVLPFPPIATLIAGVALHGLCFGCFIFVAFLIVDEESPADVRASAQSLYNVVFVGVGIIVGSKFAGWVADQARGLDAALNYANPAHTKVLFGVPMVIAALCFLAVALAYPREQRS
ncbi:MAG: MFS transporter [Planctomycetota bacterium]